MSKISSYTCVFQNQSSPSISTPASCFIKKLPFILDSLYFEYITFAVVLQILLISLFSKIKESYRWFLLNQAVWDIFILYDAQCDKPIFILPETYISTCFYSSALSTSIWQQSITTIFVDASHYAIYSSLFLLTLSRYLCMYNNRIFQRQIKSKIIFIGIISSQAVFMLIASLWSTLMGFGIYFDRRNNVYCEAKLQCTEYQCPKKFDICLKSIEGFIWKHPYYEEYSRAVIISFPTVTLLATDILAICIIVKLIKQWKFQFHYNRVNFMASVKITTIIFFQCIGITLLCFLHFVGLLKQFITLKLSLWLNELTELETIQWLSVIRIFWDSCFILCFLTEYRTRLIEIFMFPYVMVVRFCLLKRFQRTIVIDISKRGPT